MNEMTIGDLLEQLEHYRTRYGDDCPVRLMAQPSWPFEHGVLGVVSGREINRAQLEDHRDQDVADDAVVYLVEGEQLGYGSTKPWAMLG